MSACLPLKWLPDALPGQVETALRDVLDRWAREWGAPLATTVAVRLLSTRESPATALPAPWDGELPNALTSALSQALLGSVAASSPVALGALQAAIDDLRSALRLRFRPEPARPFAPARVGHGGVEASFDLMGQRFGFVLDVAALQSNGWLAAPSPRRLTAVAIEQALRDLPVPLTAQLGHASVSVTDILQLRPGDVLLLAETLDAPLKVISPGSALQLTAHLGASTTSPARAMRWLASS